MPTNYAGKYHYDTIGFFIFERQVNMNIDGIEYGLILFIEDVDGNTIEKLELSDFHAYNTFVRANKGDPKYAQCVFNYAFSEIIDGKLDSFSLTSPIAFKELTEVEIMQQIEEHKADKEYWDMHSKELDKKMKTFHFVDEGYDSEQKSSSLEEILYVCPQCMRTIEQCRCQHYPYYLVQIDKEILPIIRELNSKGYITKGCCAGHPTKESFLVSGIYISFEQDYEFDEPFPIGGKYSKLRNTLTYVPPEGLTQEQLELFQANTLDDLMEWAELLFENENIDFCEED